MSDQTTSSAIIPVPSLPGNIALYGTVEGRFAFLQAEVQFLQALLPPDLELAPQQYTPAGYHPLLLMFNKTQLHTNDNLERIAKEYNLGLNLNYNEFIVMLPYVQFKDASYNKDAPYCFLPVLYLDSLLAVLGGRVFWEFNKELARFTTDGVEYRVASELTDTTLFYSTTYMSGVPVLDQQLGNFNAIAPILSLPVIEHGPYGYVSSIYSVAYQNQYITPGSIQIVNQSCKYFPSGALNIPSIETQQLGCFNLNYDWSLTYINLIKL
jgi:Acetoacetate decarboxylase (ADC)